MSALVIDLVPRIAARRPLMVNDDLVLICEQLLEMAEDGRLTGIAFVGVQAVQGGIRNYIVDSAGEARDTSHRVVTRAMLQSLNAHLSQLTGKPNAARNGDASLSTMHAE